MSEWTLPPGMTPSQALDDIVELAMQCIVEDGALTMDKYDALGFVGVLRSVACAARLTEMRAAGVPSPILTGNVVGLRPKRVFGCGTDGDAA